MEVSRAGARPAAGGEEEPGGPEAVEGFMPATFLRVSGNSGKRKGGAFETEQRFVSTRPGAPHRNPAHQPPGTLLSTIR